MKKAELVFIPSPAIGHLVSNIEFAERLLEFDSANNRLLSVSFIIIQPLTTTASDSDAYFKSIAAADTRINFIHLPRMDPPPLDFYKSPEKFITEYLNSHKDYVKEAIVKHSSSASVPPIAGLVLDLFCTCMIDVANELGVPSYAFFTSGAAFLGFVFYLPTRGGDKEFEESDTECADIFTYVNPVPYRVLPSLCFNKHGGFSTFVNFGRRYKELKGIFVNTFEELESHAVEALMKCEQVPPVYSVGPLIDLQDKIQVHPGGSRRDEIIKWLDDQPASSVVFLCFGSRGCFGEEQTREIAYGLEQSGVRFLWSLRKPPPKDKLESPSEYTCVEEILPHGFLERTKDRGLICGWAPQKEILAHRSVGGFVSHCGWNSCLESVWFEVPIVTWPMYAEQQINAFQLVKDLGLAVELTLDYRRGTENHVRAHDLARAVGCLMDGENEVRTRIKVVSEKARLAVLDGGSSFTAYGRLIEDLLGNVP